MARGLGLGPVFAYEWLTRSRRWQAFALRSLFVLSLLGGLGLVWQTTRTTSAYLTTRQQMVQAGQNFFETMAAIQLTLIFLAAPAATAGAICLDKARGTLAHVMVTDLTDREIVLGKLAARLVPVLNLIACVLPTAALGALLGGIDPEALTGAILIAIGVAFLGCSMALALSVWMSKAYEVMLVVFAIWMTWLLALPVRVLTSPTFWAPHWLKVSNPFWLTLAPDNVPGVTSLLEPIVFLLACLLLSAGLAALAVSRVRRVYLHQANRVPRAVKASRSAAWFRRQVRWWPGPSLDKNPVLWREWHRNRPSRATRIVWGLYVLASSGFSLVVIWDHVMDPSAFRNGVAVMLNAFQFSIGLLLMAASAGTVLSEERVRGSLDILLATPMSTPSIVWGKWWGAFRNVPWLAFWPTLVTYSIMRANPSDIMIVLLYVMPFLVIAQGAALTTLGLAMATWISRTGRAVTWTISALIASIIGWPILGALLYTGNSPASRVRQITLVMGSPFYNVIMPTILLQNRPGAGVFDDMERGVEIGSIAWTAGYALIALGLYLATLWTFDRCLGRTSDRSARPGPRPGPDRRDGSMVRGWGSRTRRAAGRPAIDVASSAPPPR